MWWFSEPDYTNGRKDFTFGARLEEGGLQVFSSLQGGDRKFLKQVRGEQIFLNICFQF